MDAFRAAMLGEDGDAAYQAALELARLPFEQPEVRLALQVLTGDRWALHRATELAELVDVADVETRKAREA